MINYLNETYDGDQCNMLPNAVYYCYTLCDTETGKYYSGSRGVEGVQIHDLLSKYFTSSAVLDFKDKLKIHPELFNYRIEYFNSRATAFIAEKVFHIKHQVGKNPMFINSTIAGGTNCGAGSVLCKHNDGNTYRVTVEEFSSGRHIHVSHGMLNIRTESGIQKIHKTEFDEEFHTTEFKDYVLSLDTTTGKTCRIPKSVFYDNPQLVGITKGIVVAYDTVEKVTVSVTSDVFRNSNGRYVGNTAGLVPVINRITGEKKLVGKENYDKGLYKHHNTGNVVAYSLIERKTVTISKEEYQINSANYANQTTKIFYKVDGKFFKSKDMLNEYYKATRSKTVLKVSQFEMAKRFNDIETITREEHENGKN